MVVANESFAQATTATTVQDKICIFIFDQKGALAALSIQANKITKMKK